MWRIFSFLLTLAAWCGPASAAAVQHVFIISLDQGSPDNIAKSEMPVLKRLAAEGACTWEANTIVPSLTLPAHVSMLTGVGIQKHQILWNEFDPEKGPLKVPTIFQIAKARGLVTAFFAGKNKFKTFQRSDSFDAFFIPANPNSANIAAIFAKRVGPLKPSLCFIHFSDPDSAGHKFGVNSPEKLQAMAEADAALQVILDAIEAAGLTKSSVIIVTADHGGHDRTPAENAERQARGEPYQPGTHGSAEWSDVCIPWIAWGEGVKKNHRITSPVVTYDTAATALWLLDLPVPESFWGRPVTDAFEKR
ncbi:MAG: alkaline phosphatase family protein [Verrucomicrobiota bacterium]